MLRRGTEGLGALRGVSLCPSMRGNEEEEIGMSWKRTAAWSWSLLPFLLLAIWPGIAAAQLGSSQQGVQSDANAVLYEVTENLKLKSFEQMQRRMATSALMGTMNKGTDLCPAYLFAVLSSSEFSQTPANKCALVAMASDNLSLKPGRNFGKGPVSGEFAVVIQGDNNTDGPELVILRGTLSGNIDLSPVANNIPLGTITGRWSANGVQGGPLQGVRAHGTFTGTFRLPFTAPPAIPVPVYIGASGSPVPVGADELALGVPTVRLEVNFVAE